MWEKKEILKILSRFTQTEKVKKRYVVPRSPLDFIEHPDSSLLDLL